ncbi:MAG: response regulator [Deltaproteobacteria bacterium]|nr:response regulator [Deltaproteobacteria bacterium]
MLTKWGVPLLKKFFEKWMGSPPAEEVSRLEDRLNNLHQNISDYHQKQKPSKQKSAPLSPSKKNVSKAIKQNPLPKKELLKKPKLSQEAQVTHHEKPTPKPVIKNDPPAKLLPVPPPPIPSPQIRSEKVAEPEVLPKRVLVADTSENSFKLIQSILSEEYELKMVKDWDQLFKEMKKSEVSLLWMDLILLGAEGALKVKSLKELFPKLKIFGIASYLSEALARALPEEVQFTQIFQKPLQEEEVAIALKKYL